MTWHWRMSLLLYVLLAAGTASAAGDGPAKRLVNDRCPVMEEEPASPFHEVKYQGVPVRFCCEKCKDKFEDDPQPYLSRLPQLAEANIPIGPSLPSTAEQKADRVEARNGMRPFLLGLALIVAGALAVYRLRHRPSRPN